MSRTQCVINIEQITHSITHVNFTNSVYISRDQSYILSHELKESSTYHELNFKETSVLMSPSVRLLMAPRVRDISTCHELKDISKYHHEQVKRHLNVTTNWRRHLNITYVYISCHELNVSTYHEGRKTSTHTWRDIWISPRTQGDMWISLTPTYHNTNSIYLHITNSRRHQQALDETSEYAHVQEHAFSWTHLVHEFVIRRWQWTQRVHELNEFMNSMSSWDCMFLNMWDCHLRITNSTRHLNITNSTRHRNITNSKRHLNITNSTRHLNITMSTNSIIHLNISMSSTQ